MQTAWGRQAVQMMGYTVKGPHSSALAYNAVTLSLATYLCHTEIQRKALTRTFSLDYKERSVFEQRATLHGSFFYTALLVMTTKVLFVLQAVGWAELVGNITKIKVEYTLENKA